MATKQDQLIEHLHSVKELVEGSKNAILQDFKYRTTVVGLLRELLRSVQPLPERAWEFFLQPNVLACLRTALDAGWLDQIAQRTSNPITAAELAQARGHDRSLVVRILRLLSANNLIEEKGLETYASSDMTYLLTAPGMRDGMKHMSDNNAQTVCYMPKFFANNNYQTPPDVTNSMFTYAQGEPMWKLLAGRPERQEDFDNFMAAAKSQSKSWFEIYPVEKLKVTGDNELLLVDVGGGKGHELAGFDACRRDRSLPGKLILQDKADVLSRVPPEWTSKFTSLAHDFFFPQPPQCHNARTYYMRMIIHDWPDKECLTILKHIRDAMKPGFSTLLINDIVLPDENCSFFDAAFDISLMAILSGKERTRSEWMDLIEQVSDLKVEKIWSIEGSPESVVEVVRVT